MKKAIVLALGMLFSVGALASAEHYVRRDGDHVQHLKITKQRGDTNVLIDVDFDPSAVEKDQPCSIEIAGEAKVISENELILKRQAQGEAHYCELKIHLSGDEARIDESQDCARYFSGGLCRFGSEGKPLIRVK
jgi:hypothetical protein